MIEKTESLKVIERRAYRSTFNDGIYDIQFALLFLVFAWIPILQAVGVSRFIGYTLLIIPIVLPWMGKKYITIPRMGAVEFGPKRRSRKRLLLIISAVVFVLMAPLVVAIADNVIAGPLGWLLIALMALPIAAIAVYSTDSPRLYVYAAVLIFGIAESEFLLRYVNPPYNMIIAFGLPGIVILAIGLNLLIKFIQKYPRPTPEVPNAR
jgi:hypothetical protein